MHATLVEFARGAAGIIMEDMCRFYGVKKIRLAVSRLFLPKFAPVPDIFWNFFAPLPSKKVIMT